MAQHYIDTMITALKEFDNTFSYEAYEALAWIGLRGTVAYNNLSQEKKDSLVENRKKFRINAKNTACP